MRLYLDTADLGQIRELSRLGVLDGVTTNPAIVADAEKSYRNAVEDVAEIVDGPVFAQVIAAAADEMVREARRYQEWAADVVAKIPATREGFEALSRLRTEGIPAGATVVFSIEQAVLAAKNDATFVAPYVGRLDDAGEDGVGTVRRMQEIYDTYGFETELLAASIRNTTQAVALYEAGVDAVTMSPDVLEAHVPHPKTDEGVAGFEAAWGDRGSPLDERGDSS
ncbi:fructose-6-phosphate aldolase [Halomicroarcula limicola]|uniref:Probable transaldolase n=1 Tax=Haloarcula limicola TaxID=1429915 RepID=A0A8J8C8I5_9EURY|nr:transaldolase family protein [Halomicroarcula limicola]MBV0926113.1 fructose-6-phosphate aldolase [Halomicroarcula limicola]